MRLPAYVLGLLVAGPLGSLALTGCAADADSDQEASSDQALENESSAGDESAAKTGQENTAAPDGGAKGGPVVSPSSDPCPGCGLG